MFGKGDCRFLGNVTWDGFRWRDCEDGRGLKVQVEIQWKWKFQRGGF